MVRLQALPIDNTCFLTSASATCCLDFLMASPCGRVYCLAVFGTGEPTYQAERGCAAFKPSTRTDGSSRIIRNRPLSRTHRGASDPHR